jgi:hypothetical protein
MEILKQRSRKKAESWHGLLPRLQVGRTPQRNILLVLEGRRAKPTKTQAVVLNSCMHIKPGSAGSQVANSCELYQAARHCSRHAKGLLPTVLAAVGTRASTHLQTS